MRQETEQGPTELIAGAIAVEAEEEDDENEAYDDDDEEKIDRFKLRQYQLNRLRYFYALVECDCAETAAKIYNECDGIEYESSCTRLDIRFVPDDMVFDREPFEVCSEAPDPTVFKPNIFFTTALNQTKVECTWDETPRERKLITMKKHTREDIEKQDFKSLIATSSEEEEERDEEEERKKKNIEGEIEDASDDDEEKSVNKYKKLLSLINNDGNDSDVQMEVSWDTGIMDRNRKEEEKTKKGEVVASKHDFLFIFLFIFS
jgi:hypothetical protein